MFGKVFELESQPECGRVAGDPEAALPERRVFADWLQARPEPK